MEMEYIDRKLKPETEEAFTEKYGKVLHMISEMETYLHRIRYYLHVNPFRIGYLSVCAKSHGTVQRCYHHVAALPVVKDLIYIRKLKMRAF